MRLLVITAVFPPRPAAEAEHVLHLCRRLAARGLEVDVLTTRGAGNPADPGVRVYPVMRGWSWRDLPRLAWFLRRHRPDALLIMYTGWTYGYHPMITFTPWLAKTLVPGVSVVTEFTHDDAPAPDRSLAARLARKTITRSAGAAGLHHDFGALFRNSDRLIVLSDYYHASLTAHDPMATRKTLVIPPPSIMHLAPEGDGAARRRGRAKLGLTPEEFAFGFFGFVYPGKGVETLLPAFRAVLGQHPHARLVFIGGQTDAPDHVRYRSKITVLSEGLGICDRLTWAGGYASDSDAASVFLRAVDGCVLPFDEGGHIHRSSIVAAATHGLPLVTTRGPVADGALLHEENALLCPPRHSSALSAAMASLVDDAGLRHRLRRGVLRLAGDRFDWERAIDQTVTALRSGGQLGSGPAQVGHLGNVS